MSEPPEPTDAIVPTDPPNPFAARLEVPLQITKENEGSCVSCGFFARYDSQIDPACEIDLFTRQSGRLSKSPRFCFRQAVDLQGEIIYATVGYGDPEERVRAVVERDRHCASWYPYQPGFSPKEHREEERMMRIEEARKEHERRLTQMEVESHASAKKIQEDSLEIARAVKSFTTRWTIAAFIVAIAVLMVAIAGVIFAALTYFHSLPPTR